jgi:hypothetical protein
MAYVINKTNGLSLTTVEDGTVETKYGVKLIGKNYAGYGEIQNENFVFLMENFASNSSPSNPVEGQVWYKTSEEKLYVYRSLAGWKPLAVSVTDNQTPSTSKAGDLFWHSDNKQLSVFDGTSYILVGPQSVANAGITQMRSRSVKDTDDNEHPIIEAVVDGNVVYVISPEQFDVNALDSIATAFTTVRVGLNLPYSSTGITNTNNTQSKFHGTATNALLLDGQSVNDIIDQAGQGAFGDSGITIGNANDLAVFIESPNKGIIKNTVGSTITLKTTSGGEKIALVLSGADVLPGTNNITNLGSNAAKFGSVYAATFNGIATKADQLKVDNTGYLDASVTTLYNTIAVRDLKVVDGTNYSNVKSDFFEGIATSAYYADLAENYLADADYEPGTVLMVGGTAEVTVAARGEKAIGVVSTNPAYLMNKDLTGDHVVAVALTGRCPVKVRGEVKKGDELVACGDGFAEALTGPVISKAHFHVFAVSLGSNAGGESTVEAVIL